MTGFAAHTVDLNRVVSLIAWLRQLVGNPWHKQFTCSMDHSENLAKSVAAE